MSNTNKNTQNTKGNKKALFIVAGIIAIAIAGYYMVDGNQHKSEKKGLSQEERKVEYDKHAQELLDPLLVELAKTVSPYKFIKGRLSEVEKYTWMALDIDSTYTPSWTRLGYIYTMIHGKQAQLRYKSYKNKQEPDKVKEEEKNIILYFAQGHLYFDKALEFGTDDSANVYFLKAEAFTLQRLYDKAAIHLLEAIKLDPDNRKYKAKLIEAYLYGGRFPNALAQIERYKRTFPDSDIPYVYLAGYYYNLGDTLKTISNYETAIEKGTKPDVVKFVHHYYKTHGDEEKANFYLQKLYEAQASYDPDKY